jgi:hypothetical protein
MSAVDPKRALLRGRPASSYAVYPNNHGSLKVAISYPDPAFTDMFLDVWDHLALRLGAYGIPVDPTEEAISVNKSVEQPVKEFALDLPSASRTLPNVR